MSSADGVRRVLCLDFDGVVLESVGVKDSAYRHLFDDYSEAVRDQVLAHHRSTPGVERSQKVRELLTMVTTEEPTPKELAKRLTRFADLCRNGLQNCPMVPGVVDFLKDIKGTAAYIVSAAPGREVRETAAARGINHFFKNIFGSPPTKADLLSQIMKQEDVDPDNIIFIGDMINDFKAAEAVGTMFIGRVEAGRASPFPASTPLIADFATGAAKILAALRRPT